jgi:hypothetical protein
MSMESICRWVMYVHGIKYLVRFTPYLMHRNTELPVSCHIHGYQSIMYLMISSSISINHGSTALILTAGESKCEKRYI